MRMCVCRPLANYLYVPLLSLSLILSIFLFLLQMIVWTGLMLSDQGDALTVTCFIWEYWGDVYVMLVCN